LACRVDFPKIIARNVGCRTHLGRDGARGTFKRLELCGFWLEARAIDRKVTCMSVLKIWFAVAALSAALIGGAVARDDGRYAGSPLKPWFDTLKSSKGLCCSDADGFAVSDPDWDSQNGHYRVRLDGEWIVVPDDAVITEPNRAGRTMVWPIKGSLGTTIRCFLPGSMT
jgi:hypothetical protein